MTSPAPLITLLTDFGESSPYVAAMKAVILSICPDARLVDLCHVVRPQAVEEGAFLLSTLINLFPPRTIHVAVVDPGVGTARRAIALRTATAMFVGPDNGLLTAALPDSHRPAADSGPSPVPLPPGVDAIHLTNARYFRPTVSATFHGRDIFAPVAAHLAAGTPLAAFGEPLSEVLAFGVWRGVVIGPSTISGRVVHVDHYGNCVTTVRGEDLASREVIVEVAGQRFAGLQRTFQDRPEFVVYVGSSGFLEIALRNGDAAAALNIGIGEPVAVHLRTMA
jgi:hypothetical protein